MREATVGEICRTWGLGAPVAVRPPSNGTNNLVRIVETATATYVLRGYQNLSPERIAAEHLLLAALARTDFPLAVPTPLPTPDGQTSLHTSDGVASVFPYLPGRPADRHRPIEVERAGQALGELDLALATLPAELAPIDWRRGLDQVHPAVPDVDDLADELAAALPAGARLASAGVDWLRGARPVDEAYARLFSLLPAQIIHADFGLSNLLVDDEGRPTAMLDFEIAGLDLTVNDLVAGVFQATSGWWTPGGAELSETFCRGYAHRVQLAPDTWEAFPTLLRRRALGSAVWRAGRWRRGQASLDEVQDRLAEGVELETWLSQHANTLVDNLAAL